MTQPKPQPWYTQFNQPPRSAKQHGRNWKPSPPTYRDPSDGTHSGVDPGGKDDSVYITWIASTFYPLFTEPKPPALPHAGIRAGELTGHRMWFVLENNQLSSLAHYFIWEPNATIEGNVDELVDRMFGLLSMNPIYGGVYSYSTPDPMLRNFNEYRDFPTRVIFDDRHCTIYGVAYGTIKNWGEVIEHEHGYRAQYAKLTSIDKVIGVVDLNALRSKYNVT